MKRLTVIMLLALASLIAVARPAEVVRIETAGATAAWTPLVPHDALILNVSLPSGDVVQARFKEGTEPHFTVFEEGLHTWEILVAPRIDEGTRALLADAREQNDEALGRRILEAAGICAEGQTASGAFTVLGGTIIAADGMAHEPGAGDDSEAPGDAGRAAPLTGDLTVRNSLCVGGDCADYENYGYDTFRLKENNLRIHFDDTSSTGSFPYNDWRITINDSADGGANYFSIDDATGGRVPFKIEAGARSNALYVDNGGSYARIGINTASPSEELDISKDDSPTIRLHQDGSWYPLYNWDILGNEANFMIRDTTNSSSFAFRIRPGCATNTLTLSNSRVGMGTWEPAYSLDVYGTSDRTIAARHSAGATAGLVGASGAARIGSLSNHNTEFMANGTTYATLSSGGNFGIGTAAPAQLLDVGGDVDGAVRITTVADGYWDLYSDAGAFALSKDGAADPLLALDGGGHLTVQGVLTQGSSRAIKKDFVSLDGCTLLDRLSELTVLEWSYIHDATGSRHVSPMAEDFHALFGLGADARHLAPSDVAGVALAAAKELAVQNTELRAENEVLNARLAALETAVAALQQAAE